MMIVTAFLGADALASTGMWHTVPAGYYWECRSYHFPGSVRHGYHRWCKRAYRSAYSYYSCSPSGIKDSLSVIENTVDRVVNRYGNEVAEFRELAREIAARSDVNEKINGYLGMVGAESADVYRFLTSEDNSADEAYFIGKATEVLKSRQRAQEFVRELRGELMDQFNN